MDVRDRVVVVAGGAGSLGTLIARSLIEKQARVAIVDAKAPAADWSGQAFYVQADLTNEDEVAAATQTICARFDKISVLVNCAGLIHSEPLVSLTDAAQRRHAVGTWNAVIASNLTATFLLSSHVAEHMALTRSKGVIVNFSSIAALGNSGQTAYAAAKAGVEAMTRVWARELGPLGIRAVAIAPGFVSTASTAAALSETALSEVKRKTPLLRLAKPAEIASAVAFAIENDFLTGTTISVSGGLAF